MSSLRKRGRPPKRPRLMDRSPTPLTEGNPMLEGMKSELEKVFAQFDSYESQRLGMIYGYNRIFDENFIKDSEDFRVDLEDSAEIVAEYELIALDINAVVFANLKSLQSSDVLIFRESLENVLPWFSKKNLSSETKDTLGTFMSNLLSLAETDLLVCEILRGYVEKFVDMQFPDFLIEICSIPKLAEDIYTALISRLLDALAGFSRISSSQFDVDGPRKNPTNTEAKWSCVRLANLSLDVIQTTISKVSPGFAKTLMSRLEDICVPESEVTLNFFITNLMHIVGNRSGDEE